MVEYWFEQPGTAYLFGVEMKQNYRASMIQLHTYSGLFMGWLLFAIFATGTLSYFSNEIGHWMRGVISTPQPINAQLEQAYQHLLDHTGQSHRWSIAIVDKRGSELLVQWRDEAGRNSHNLTAQAAPEQTAKATRGGHFFVTFHYTLQLRQYGGRYFAGLAAMTMLIALYSGIFTHRRIIKDFFTLRTRSFLHFIKDGHAVTGIVTIPFVIVICLSALVIYINLFAPWFADEHFEQGYRQMSREVSERLPVMPDNQQPATPIASVAPVLEHALATWPATVGLKRIILEQPYQLNGRIILEGVDSTILTNNTQKLVYRSATGEFVGIPSEEGAARKIRRVLYGLHEGHFFALDLRWLSFIQGLLATFLIATGMLIWVKKRAERRVHSPTTLMVISRINLAIFSGFPLACLAYFAANQYLPAQMSERDSVEVAVFNYGLLFAAVISLGLNQRASMFVLSAAAVLCCVAIVAVDLPALFYAVEQRDVIYTSVGLSMWVALLLSALTFWYRLRVYRKEVA